jgi:mono/diheme cytochrome c family protein
MRSIAFRTASFAAAALAVSLVLTINSCGLQPAKPPVTTENVDQATKENVDKQFSEGQEIFRFDTFGSEAFWTQTQLHRAIAGEKNGGVGPGVSPKQALALGLKVDMFKVPPGIAAAVATGKANLDDPANTVALLKAGAVVGVKGIFEGDRMTGIGITCALCHSTVDDKLQPGIGRRLDGWANRDLNVGAIVAAAPELSFDGKALRPDGKPAATLIPSAFGLLGVNNHTWTGAWGGVTYWNAYVAVTQMGGRGNFSDPRLGINVTHTPDLVTSKLPALRAYQHSLPAPPPPAGSFDAAAAARGKPLFDRSCASCHVGGSGTDNNNGVLHPPGDTGVDGAYAARTASKAYRTTPLRGLWQHAPYFHDGSAATLADVVTHYNRVRTLGLTAEQQRDLVEYLKSK